MAVKRWVAWHGFALNVSPNLDHFTGIVPCGLAEFPVASLASIGARADMGALDDALRASLPSFLSALQKKKS